MKKIIRKTVFGTLLLGTLTSYAIETSLEKRKENVIEVTLTNVKKGQLLFIKNSRGKIIYKNFINVSGSIKKEFDFNTLENGYYILEIDKDFQIDILPFTIISGEAIFHKKAEKIVFKPSIRADENKVLISKLDFEATPMQVSICYENEIIFKETIEGCQQLKRIYSLEKKKEAIK